ncbi:hypothetical protein [Morganella morganii]|uniref:hypothetical protein n=1 Tax=Morganella morganii TaxID=582 RepID=UPI000BFC7F68|nr:hypothetical protein [Morganella morganii]MBT0307154.1 hypothetical protein [Morganella morganii subsp. morganii]PHH09358.1 hypothetical protein CRX48_12905 [Morganella morganii]
MKHSYTGDHSRPDYDEKITSWLKNKTEPMFGSMSYPVALYHDGFLYRKITGSGLNEYVSICNFLEKIGLVNLLAPDATFRGYDAVFAIPAVKTEMDKIKKQQK